jgi:endonuclease/exonuclease/phosphatase (EEP) superfamily protein YafD
MSRRARIGTAALAPILLAPATAGLLGALGFLFDPADILAEISGLLIVPAILCAGIAIAGWPARLPKPITLLAVCGLVACLGLTTPELIKATSAAAERAVPSAGDTVIVSMNLWDGSPDYGPAADAILKAGADIVTLQEGLALLHSGLPKLAASYPYRATCPQWWGCEIVILSKRPFSRTGWLPPKAGQRPLWIVWAETSGADGHPLTIVSTHLGQLSPARQRRLQEAELHRALLPMKQRDLILTGDFNASGSSWALRRMDRLVAPLSRRSYNVATWPDQIFGGRATNPAPFLGIDHLYAGPAWRTVDVERLPPTRSDHRGLRITLSRERKL